MLEPLGEFMNALDGFRIYHVK